MWTNGDILNHIHTLIHSGKLSIRRLSSYLSTIYTMPTTIPTSSYIINNNSNNRGPKNEDKGMRPNTHEKLADCRKDLERTKDNVNIIRYLR